MDKMKFQDSVYQKQNRSLRTDHKRVKKIEM